jgi:Glycosyl hydrolases family 43
MTRSRVSAALTAAAVATALAASSAQAPKPAASRFLTQPLVTSPFTADPSAHVFDGRIYIYPSHDIEAGVKPDDLGSHFAMRDYHVFSMDAPGGKVTDHGVALDIKDVPWAGRQMWAPDAAEKDGRYYLYFPVKDKQDVFRIGVAVGKSPSGPFAARPQPIEGSYSIDPAVFKDTDGRHYMYFGGIWGGQLQRWATGTYVPKDVYPAKDQPALMPKVARLADDMLGFADAPRDLVIQDEQGRPLTAGSSRRPGCTSTRTPTTSPTRPATRTSSSTPPGSRRTDRSPTAARSSSRSWAGRTITRSSRSRGRGTSSTMTRRSQGARRISATSR